MIRRHPIVATVVGIPLVLTLTLGTLVSLWLAGVPIPGASAARWFTITKTANADYTPSPDKPVFILAHRQRRPDRPDRRPAATRSTSSA